RCLLRPPPISTLFPYTTLFRSQAVGAQQDLADQEGHRQAVVGLIPGLAAHFADRDAFDVHARDASGEPGPRDVDVGEAVVGLVEDRKSTRLNSSHLGISYAVFC